MNKLCKKILLIVLILFIISGIIILCTMGFKKSIAYEGRNKSRGIYTKRL